MKTEGDLMTSKNGQTDMMDSLLSSPFSPSGSNGFVANYDDELEAARNIVNEMIRTTLEIQHQMERGEL